MRTLANPSVRTRTVRVRVRTLGYGVRVRYAYEVRTLGPEVWGGRRNLHKGKTPIRRNLHKAEPTQGGTPIGILLFLVGGSGGGGAPPSAAPRSTRRAVRVSAASTATVREVCARRTPYRARRASDRC